jgi:hypothetical protein
VGVWTGIATALLIPVIDLLINNRKYLRVALSALIHRENEIRISFSYLLRVQDGSNYLLVRGKRYRNQYQPIGGVYKFNPSARPLFSKWRVLNDELIPIDDVSTDDLRLRVPALKILRFLRWFESGQNREVGIWREFYEEMVVPGHVSLEDFAVLQCDFLRTHIEPLRYSHHAGRYELLVAHIFELVPTESQLEALRKLNGQSEDAPGWFSEEQVRRRGATLGMEQPVEIPPTASWTL